MSETVYAQLWSLEVQGEAASVHCPHGSSPAGFCCTRPCPRHCTHLDVAPSFQECHRCQHLHDPLCPCADEPFPPTYSVMEALLLVETQPSGLVDMGFLQIRMMYVVFQNQLLRSLPRLQMVSSAGLREYSERALRAAGSRLARRMRYRREESVGESRNYMHHPKLAQSCVNHMIILPRQKRGWISPA